MLRKKLTLCLVHQHPKILLGMKKRGFGVGKWNGFGGKLEEKETIEQAAKREVQEEAGIEVKKIKKIGVLDFDVEKEFLQVHIFKATEFFGEPRETEEMKPSWFYIDELPFAQMWPDDVYWIPLFLKNKTFEGKFVIDKDYNILEKQIRLL